MSTQDKGYADCKSMTEIRENIDRMDRLIVPLIAERADYVRQAAAFKKTRPDVHVPWRIEDVVTKVKALAEKEGMDLELIEAIYRALVDHHIAYEWREWDKIHK